MGDRTTDGPAMRRSMQTDMRTTRHLNHFLPIPTSGVGTVLVKSDPATTQGIPTTGSHQSSRGRMLPGRVDRFGQNAVFTKRCFPAVRANSRRHPQPQAAVIQNKQLTTAAMQNQLQTPSPQQCILQQGQCTGITHPDRLRWNRVRCSCQHRCGIDATEQRCTKHQHASIHHRIGPVFLRHSEPKER